jgi:chemotaxis protein MotB
MARGRRHEEEENHERWLVSYADYMTLLFAFFVVMFATSSADKHKAKQVSDSVRRAYGNEKPGTGDRSEPSVGAPPNAPQLQPAADPGPADPSGELRSALRMLEEELREEIELGKVQVRLEDRGVVISLQEAAFFRPGDDAILPEITGAIKKMARVLTKAKNPIRLEGHTDAAPISGRRFATNWHLSTARALSMFGFLTVNHHLAAARFTIAGYGDTVPVDGNDTPEGRARNRRVDVVLMQSPRHDAATEAVVKPREAVHLPVAGPGGRDRV